MYLVHQLVHTDVKSHGCNVCTKQFKCHGDLKNHVKAVHNNDGEGFAECYFCYKKFSQSSNLVGHMRIHTQEQPFICKEKLCTYSCANLGNLKRHQRSYHNSTSNQINAKILKCYFCLKSCTKLIIHMRRHTKEVPFKCGFCNRKYISQPSLKHHIASHTNEKPFKCSQCYKEFRKNSHLKQHMVSHT